MNRLIVAALAALAMAAAPAAALTAACPCETGAPALWDELAAELAGSCPELRVSYPGAGDCDAGQFCGIQDSRDPVPGTSDMMSTDPVEADCFLRKNRPDGTTETFGVDMLTPEEVQDCFAAVQGVCPECASPAECAPGETCSPADENPDNSDVCTPGGEGTPHFQCYGMGPTASFAGVTVAVEDQFGSGTLDLESPPRVCAPARKNGELPGTDLEGDHLTVYRVDGASGFDAVRNVEVVNQFGTVVLNLERPTRFMVPTVKSLTGPPTDDPIGTVRHYTCHRVRRTPGTPRSPRPGTVSVETQFETVDLRPQRPHWLCAPTNKNGEDPDAVADPQHLLCYRSKARGRGPSGQVFLHNQLDLRAYSLSGKRREFCVPSLATP